MLSFTYPEDHLHEHIIQARERSYFLLNYSFQRKGIKN